MQRLTVRFWTHEDALSDDGTVWTSDVDDLEVPDILRALATTYRVQRIVVEVKDLEANG